MVELKTDAEINMMARAGKVVREALENARIAARPGVTTRELDRVVGGVLDRRGAKSATKEYAPRWARSPYPADSCISINETIVHGIPGDYRQADGDLVTVDVVAELNRWCADAAVTFIVGTPRSDDLALVEIAENALTAGIDAAIPGTTVGDISHAIGDLARRHSVGVLADHYGHGLGRTMHEAPEVPNDGRPGRGYRLRPGLVIAIEPQFIADGSTGYVHDDDGWSVKTATGARAVHVEHTVAITAEGPRVLTASD